MPNITTNHAIICLYFYPQRFVIFTSSYFKLSKPIKLQKFLMQQYKVLNFFPLASTLLFACRSCYCPSAAARLFINKLLNPVSLAYLHFLGFQTYLGPLSSPSDLPKQEKRKNILSKLINTYSRTSRKRPPKMRGFTGLLLELVV